MKNESKYTDTAAWLPNAQTLVERCERQIKNGRQAEASEVLGGLGIPGGDLSVTPLGLRAGLLGTKAGTAFFHHELRIRLPMPKALEPEMAVWDEGTVPLWKEGVLAEPKYFSFFQDSPLIAFNPNHRRKWPAHELLHGAVGFFWRPDMTRFEAYLGSRLNELLPVVHWHGFDDIFRGQCDKHLGEALYTAFCPACEAIDNPYWELTDEAVEALRPAALRHAQHGLSHFETEWSACHRELSTGRPISSPLGKLDASSDARAYLRSHWNRMTAWSFGTWVELFCVDGVDYHSTLEGMMHRVGSVTQELLGDEPVIGVEGYESRRARRLLQDVSYRAFIALESLDETTVAAQRAEALLMPILEEASKQCSVLLEANSGGETIDGVLPTLKELIGSVEANAELFGEELAGSFGALGLRWVDLGVGQEAELAQLQQGSLSLGLADHTEDQLLDLTTQLHGSPHIDLRGSLCERLATLDGADVTAVGTLLGFEAFLKTSPKSDPDAEDFAVLPEDQADLFARGGVLRLNESLRRGTFPAGFIREQMGEEMVPESSEDESVTLLGGWFMGEPRLLLIDDELEKLIRLFDQPVGVGTLERVYADPILNLLNHGMVVWIPDLR
ncbi:MAG: hypothetical protein HOI23_16020 [Deltaproteobacteria bacterium]|jgi:hypothetical protein|nr:hypothetical protein [Deltaproteobacteria bacterium]MBT6433087.1 hypothetical protein [Deltaproteobacteria bacterium]MBT6491968.1 hypothetical protein [Deltaproteobacteria bacterium]